MSSRNDFLCLIGVNTDAYKSHFSEILTKTFLCPVYYILWLLWPHTHTHHFSGFNSSSPRQEERFVGYGLSIAIVFDVCFLSLTLYFCKYVLFSLIRKFNTWIGFRTTIHELNEFSDFCGFCVEFFSSFVLSFSVRFYFWLFVSLNVLYT